MAMERDATIKVTTTDLLTVSKAAKELGQHRTTIYRWIEARKIIAVNLGGVLFIPKSEIERLKNEKNNQATRGNQVA